MANLTFAPSTAGTPGVLTCWPGPRPTAGLIGVDLADVHLMLLLDPVTIALTLPPDTADWPAMARLLREMADAADLMADRIDPAGLMQPSWSEADGG
jgi:hypothetical protein